MTRFLSFCGRKKGQGEPQRKILKLSPNVFLFTFIGISLKVPNPQSLKDATKLKKSSGTIEGINRKKCPPKTHMKVP